MAGSRKTKVKDTAVIYYSTADKAWIAHSLRTDQIGTGDCVVQALTDLMEGVRNLIILSNEDKTVRVLREAPASIQRRKFRRISSSVATR